MCCVGVYLRNTPLVISDPSKLRLYNGAPRYFSAYVASYSPSMSYDILKEASSSYKDWSGTAAADQHGTIGHKSAHELVGLDSDKWWIVGYDFQGQHLTKPGHLYIYAVDRQTYNIKDYDALQQYGTNHGSIPVTSFLVHDVSPADFISTVFNQFQVQLRTRSLENHDLSVMELADLNLPE